MKVIEIKGVGRINVGKKATRELRKADHVPCVIYGGDKIVHFSAESKEFRHLVYTPNVYVVNLEVDGAKYTVIMKDLQFHPVTDAILHIDFLEVAEDKEVNISIPVKIEGLAEGVKQGGRLNLLKRKLKVRGLLKDLPETLNINVEAVELGKSIKVGECSFDNLSLLDPSNDVITSVQLTRSALSAKMAGGEGADGESAAK